MSGRTAYVTHFDCSRHDTGWKHPEHQGRLPAVARAVHRDMLTLFEHLLEVEGVPATTLDLRTAHAAEYIARVERRCREAEATGRVLDFEGEAVVSGATWDAALAAVGCVLTAVERVRAGEARNAFCAVRPPGHGAGRDAPGDFALFNAVAIAALRAVREPAAGSVWVVEWGSRPGRGSAGLLADQPNLRFISIHARQEPTAAIAGPGIVTRPVAEGAGGAEVLQALRDALDEAEAELPPDLVLLSLGCDGLSGDPLGRLAMEPADFHRLTDELRGRADRLCGGRMVSALEEGYAPDRMARAVVQHLRSLAGLAPDEG